MEEIKLDYEFDAKVITKAERVLPKDWSYEKSVKKVKQMVYKWKKMTVEILHEIWLAHKMLAKKGRPKKTVPNGTVSEYSQTWNNYCEDCGIGRSTAWRWLNLYDEKGMKLIELKKEKKEIKEEGGEYVEGIKEQVEQIEADIKMIEQEIEEDAEKDSEKIQLVKEEESFVDMTDEAEEDIRKEIKETRKVINKKKERYLNANIGLVQCVTRMCYVNNALVDISKLWPDLKDTAKSSFMTSFNILKQMIIKEKMK